MKRPFLILKMHHIERDKENSPELVLAEMIIKRLR
jgi:hypothetical protein